MDKLLSGDKALGLEPDIHFYILEYDDKTAEGEEAEILVLHDSNLVVSNQKLIKMKLPYINTFDHEGPAVVNVMRDLTSGVFENLDIPYPIEVYQRVAYKQRILRGAAHKNTRRF